MTTATAATTAATRTSRDRSRLSSNVIDQDVPLLSCSGKNFLNVTATTGATDITVIVAVAGADIARVEMGRTMVGSDQSSSQAILYS